ncbi:MAG: hypothetical protein Q7S17_08850 [Xanthobacteraceae bacterium]|nr:hypothetical protein [Xanthobacteraceae bacterium]
MHCTRYAVLCVLINLLRIALFLLPAPAGARAEVLNAEISASVGEGHGRMIFTFSAEVKAEAQVANGILVIAFRRPVAVAIDKLEQKLPGYVQAARRDPDGTAVRFSLARKVTVNVMEAGEKLFVDLLPDGWVGLPPGLPQEVVDDLAKRAREAERRARDKPARVGKSAAPVRLRLATAPTFSRFAFEMTEPIYVSLARDGQELRLLFDAPVKIDLGEAKTQLPAGVVALDVESESDRSTVKLVLAPQATARDFREENSFLIDVMPPPLGLSPPSIEELAAEVRARAADKAELPAVAGPGVSDDARPAPIDLTSRPDGVNGTVFAAARRQSGRLSISFPFGEPTAAAAFRREDTLWLVFDSARSIDVSELANDPSQILRGAEFVASELGGVVRLKLTRARLPSVEREGFTWVVTLGDGVAVPSRPLPMRRASAEDERAAILILLQAPGQVHRLVDPEIGDSLLAVTAMPPARGILRGQDFVEFKALASIHGVALTPLADDLSVTLTSEGVTVGRPTGLMVSDLPDPPPPPKKLVKRQFTPLDAEIWKAERDSPYYDREAELVAALAHTQPGQRAEARIMLARFYLANDFATEAKGTLDTRDDNQLFNHPLYDLLHGIAELKLGRAAEALTDLTRPPLAGVSEALLMRTIALAGLSRWGDVRDALRTGANALPNLPIDYQRLVLLSGIRAAVELRDFIEASRLIYDIEAIEIPDQLKPAFAVLAGRVADGVGRFEQAKELYETAALADSGPAAAEARLRSVEMRSGRGELSRVKAIDRLEMQAWSWRGDRIELESLRLLARLYVGEARYRDAFRLLDAALLSYPEDDITREFQNEMATVFEDIFLTGKAEAQPAIEALAIYYDFSKLTPIGRRGDELIRRLADRLVAVDLLDQATELLDHQVEYRLSGAAKAQVAARLAVIHLMNRKPTEAVRVLAATRMPELPQDLRDQRLLIEARALSDTGRHDGALELINNLTGPEADRLRADIAWAAKNWREAGERIEKLLGERWKNDAPLSETERHDVLRAVLAFALGNESIWLSRLREKYADKMGAGSESKVLTMVSSPEGTNAKTLAQAAKALSAFDSLGNFLSLYRARYPERPLPPDPLPTATATKGKVTTR